MDSHYAFVYTAVNVFCLLTALIVLSKLSYNIGSERQVRIFRLMTIAFLGFLICELIWGLSMGGFIPVTPHIASSFKILSTLFIPLMVYLWFVFAETRFGSTWPSRPMMLVLTALPFLALVVMYIANHKSGLIFSIDAAGQLIPGPAAGLTGLVDNIYGVAIIAHAVFLFFREKVSYKRSEYITQIVFIVMCTVGGIIDAAVSNTPVMPLAITLSFIFLLTNIQESQIYNDGLTGLNNRRRADQYLVDAIDDADHKDPFYLFMLDIDRFKRINDTYGHLEGDRALKLMANTLASEVATYGGFAARWGGDEFMAIIESTDENLPQVFTEELAARLDAVAKEAGLAYPLTASVGYAACTSKSDKMTDLIEQADKILYENKKKLPVVVDTRMAAAS